MWFTVVCLEVDHFSACLCYGFKDIDKLVEANSIFRDFPTPWAYEEPVHQPLPVLAQESCRIFESGESCA